MTSLTNLSSGIIPSSSAGGLPQPPDTPIIQQRPFSFQPVPRPMQTSSFTPVPMEVDAAMHGSLQRSERLRWTTSVVKPGHVVADCRRSTKSIKSSTLPSAMSQKHEAPSLIQPPALEPFSGAINTVNNTSKLFRLQRFQPLRLIDSRHSGGSQANQEVQESVRFHCLKCPSTASLGGSQSTLQFPGGLQSRESIHLAPPKISLLSAAAFCSAHHPGGTTRTKPISETDRSAKSNIP